MASPSAPAWRLILPTVLLVLASVLVPMAALPAPSSAPAFHGFGGGPPPAFRAACTPANMTTMRFQLSGPNPVSSGGNNSSNTFGPAPANLTIAVTFSGPVGTYDVSMQWGDGANNTSVTSSGPCGVANVTYTHEYTLAAFYLVQLGFSFSSARENVSEGEGFSIHIFGPAGPNADSATANVTAGPVPLTVRFAAYAPQAPGNVSAQFIVYPPTGGQIGTIVPLQVNASASWYTNLTIPGLWPGYVTFTYPDGLVYDWAPLPTVNVTPLADLAIASVSNGGLPRLATYWANATNLTGGPYASNDTVEWLWSPSNAITNGTPYIGSAGGITGSPVVHEWWLNTTASVSWPIWASLVRSDGVTVATASAPLYLSNNSGSSGGGPSLALAVTPSNGTAPLNFSVQASLSTGTSPNGTHPYVLDLTAVNESNGSLAWNATVASWNGAPVSVSGILVTAGAYRLNGIVSFTGNASNATPYASANTTIVVFPVSTVGAPTVALTGNSSNASVVPMVETVFVTGSGGVSPYALDVCLIGPTTAPGTNGTCSTVATYTSWNGSALSVAIPINASGNYTVRAELTDASQTRASALLSFAASSAPAGPLAVGTSRAQVTGLSSVGASYVMQVTVTGGRTPYEFAWSFGDGSPIQSTTSSTVTHTYTVSGLYAVLVTVTDAAGVVRSLTLGPLAVHLPTLAVAPWWASAAVVGLAAAATIAAAALLVGIGRRRGQRREALNWRESLEGSGAAEDPGVPPR
jgi:hypothetical protein